MPTPNYDYSKVGTGQFSSTDPSVMGRVTGDSGPADIDHVNIWMRSQPWYQQILQQNGGNASSDQAKQDIVRAAQQNGVQVDQGGIEVDNSGNFKTSGMSTWGKVLIVAGVAAASIATMGAAGMFAAAGVPGTAGTIGTDAILAGEAGLTTTGAGAASALGGLGAAGGIGVEGLGAGAVAAGGAGVGLGPFAGMGGAGGAGGSSAAAAGNFGFGGAAGAGGSGAAAGGTGAASSLWAPASAGIDTGASSGGSLAASGLGGAAGGGMKIPMSALIPGIGNFLDTYMASSAQSQAAQAQTQTQRQALAQSASVRDPFLNKMQQAGDIAKLDRLATYKPLRESWNPYDTGQGTPFSPDVVSAANTAKTAIESGQTDPAMNDPNNWGKNGALNLLALATKPTAPPKQAQQKPGWAYANSTT